VRCSAAAGSRDYYGVLGVQRSATAKEIKSAFRKKALKLHPDVNKAPDAKEQFMAAKEAFQVLSDAETRGRYDRQASGGFDWGNPFGSAGFGGGGGSSSSSSSGSRSGRKQQPEEEFYGFSAFFGDIEREWKERRRRRQKEPASLWEELADIGEEFVEFLERELGLPSFEAEKQAASSDSDSRNAAARQAAASAAQRSNSSAQTAAQRATETAAKAKQDAEAKAKAEAKAINDDVEDMLAELKRKQTHGKQ
jgi:molecular chaperone DnaJ